MNSVDGIFNALKAGISARGPELVKQMKGVVVYDVGGKKLTLDLKTGNGSASDGQSVAKPDLIITIGESDFLSLATGKLNPQQAFMSGKLKIKGNMGMALKLQTVMEAARKELDKAGGNVAAATAAASSTTTTASTKPSPAKSTAKSAPLFEAIGTAIKGDGPALVKKVNGIVQFTLTSGTGSSTLASYVLNLKTGNGSLTEGTPAKGDPSVDVVITVSDDDFLDLANGKATPQQMFMKGKLKVKGNMGLALKVGSILSLARPSAKL